MHTSSTLMLAHGVNQPAMALLKPGGALQPDSEPAPAVLTHAPEPAALASAAESRVCSVCTITFAKYTCPRCFVAYCGLGCYKRHGQGCTEAFYRDQVMESLETAQGLGGVVGLPTAMLKWRCFKWPGGWKGWILEEAVQEGWILEAVPEEKAVAAQQEED